jgi:putative addiction module component (TIGR02574 family)
MSSSHDAARRILAEALELPAEERAGVAAELLASLPADEPATDAEWMTELERRAVRFRRGEVQGIPWDQVHRNILSELRKP